MKRIDHITGQPLVDKTAEPPVEPGAGRPEGPAIDYDRLARELLCRLEAHRGREGKPVPPADGPLPDAFAHEPHPGPHPGRPPHQGGPRPGGPCQVIPLPPHHVQRVALDADELADALAARGLSSAERAVLRAPAEVKIAVALLLDVPVAFADAPAMRPPAFGFDDPLLSGEPLQRLADALGTDPARVAAELSGAPAEMTALLMLVLQERDAAHQTPALPEQPPAPAAEEA